MVCITNAILSGTLDQVESFVSMGILTVFPGFLTEKNSKILLGALDCLRELLIKGEQIREQRDEAANPFLIKLEDNGLLPYIENLQHHENIDVYKKISNLIEMFFKHEL